MSDDHYYDIYVSACGFLNRLRTVEHSDGQSSLVCTFAALRGAKGERAQPTYFDAKIVGERTKALLDAVSGMSSTIGLGRSLSASG